MALVTEHGFAAVTVDDIAAEAGVSRRSFFNHFPTKAAALFDPHPDQPERLRALLEAADLGAGPWRALAQVCAELVADSAAVLPIRRRLVEQHPELEAYQRTAHHYVQSTLDSWTRAQVPDPLTAHLIVEAANAIMLSAFLTWTDGDDPADLKKLVEQGFERVEVRGG